MFTKAIQIIPSIIVISTLTACGGGGGGDGGTPTPTEPPLPIATFDGNNRVSKIEHDYDNNDVTDAITVISYSNDAKKVTSTYTYIGDGTPDKFIKGSDAPNTVSEAIFSDEGKQLSLSMQETKTSGATSTIKFSYAYNEDDTLQKLTTEVNGNAFVYNVNYINGVMSSLTTSDVGQPQITLAYETDGTLKVLDINNSGISSGRSDYVWRADGQLATINTQYEVPVPDSSYVLQYTDAGVIVSATQTSGQYPTNEDLNLTEIYSWNGNLLTGISWDPLSTGSVVSKQTITWEDGDCYNIYALSLGGAGGYTPPFFTRSESAVFVPGVFSLNPICSL